VSSKLLGQFADNLKKDVLTGGPTAGEAPTDPGRAPHNGAARGTGSPADAGPRKIQSKEAEPIDLMDAAGGSVGKRIVPIIAGLVVVIAIRRIFKRRKKRHAKGRSIRHDDE
jgi:hypothetical protein